VRADDDTVLGYQVSVRDISILGFRHIIQDRTDRERAEAALRAKAQELDRTSATLEEKERLLAAFQQVGEATIESLDIDTILDRLASELVKAGIFRSLMVALVDEGAGHVEVVRGFVCQSDEAGEVIPGSEPQPTDNMLGLRYDLDDDNITAEVARTGEMQVLDTWDQRLDPRVDDPGRHKPKVAYFIPVTRGDRVLAVLATGSHPDVKEDTLLRIGAMEPLLSQVGIALEHALLYQALQRSLAEVQRLKDRLQDENTYLQDEMKVEFDFGEIVTRSETFRAVLERVEQVAATEATVLILGESGTGKELLAHGVHDASPRSDRHLVKVNCAALPANLIESELFGHERGAFTGATARKIGRFELADGGTIFLDEIGELPLELQAKLLRVVQEGEFERLGSSETRNVDVRVVAATNRDLHTEAAEGRFRQDLYYRLNVFPILVPPLRDRLEDIPVLVRHFAEKHGNRAGRPPCVISNRVVEALQGYSWPGNVRELENCIERAAILAADGRIRVEHLHLPDAAPDLDSKLPSPEPGVQASEERERILRALEATRWNRRQAARDLGMSYSTLRYKILRLHIQ
jgi:transcriptional regulator with GAF, ATPase, and Fis domain